MASAQITAKQSRQARSLLQWNTHDVVSKCTLTARRFEHFERGIVRFTRPEMDALVKTYTDHGIIFTRDYEVRLIKKEDGQKMRAKLGEQDIVEDVNEIKQLSHGMDKVETFDADEETAKEFSDRVKHLVNLKEDEKTPPDEGPSSGS